MSILLHHRQSKLHLLDSTTMTSFPSPQMTTNTPLANSDLMADKARSFNSANSISHLHLTYQDGNIQEEVDVSINTHKILDSFINRTKHHLAYSKSTPYLSTTKNIDIDTQLNGNYKFSVSDSIMSNNIISTSKLTTPPSSYDYTSPYYDYRLVLENSEHENINTRNTEIPNKQEQKKEQEHFMPSIKINDMYIKSIYDDIYLKSKIKPEIKCITCDLPVFDNEKYINKFLEFDEIICESCINNKSRNNSQENARFHADSSTLDIYPSPNDTNNTIQVYLDTTIQSDDNLTIEQQRIMNSFILANINDKGNENDTNINNSYKHNKYANIIVNLKNIENHDLKVRQSIADFRNLGNINNSSYNHNNTAFNDKVISLWSFLKRRFINFE